MADTGAQVNIIDVETVKAMGLDTESLIPCTTTIKGAAAGSKMDIQGVLFLDVAAPGPPRVRARVPQLFHVARNTQNTYLSYQCLLDLGVVSPSYPRAGEAWSVGQVAGVATQGDTWAVPECTYEGVGECKCPPRELPPREPAQLPCAPTQENIPKLEEYIRRRYSASAFNVCTRQRIPTLSGSPPLKLNVGPEITPVACHKLATVPLHWQQAVPQVDKL